MKQSLYVGQSEAPQVLARAPTGKLAKLLLGVDGLLPMPGGSWATPEKKKKKKALHRVAKAAKPPESRLASLPFAGSQQPAPKYLTSSRYPTPRIQHHTATNPIRRHAQIIPPPLVANITPAVGVHHPLPARICPRLPETVRIRSAGIRCRRDRCAAPRSLYMLC